MEVEAGSNQLEDSNRPVERKNYKKLEIIAGLNLVFAVFNLPITFFLTSVCIIGIFIIFLPSVIGIAVIYYSIKGVKKWNWPMDLKYYSLIIAGILAIIIHISIILIFSIGFARYVL